MTKLLVALLFLGVGADGAWADAFKGSDKYKSHLEFLGYDVADKKKSLQAKHGKYLNIWLKQYQQGILVIGYFGRNKEHKNDEAGFHKMINDLNKGASAARYYEDKDGDLAVEAWYPGGYEKVRFGVFMDSFHQTRSQLQKEDRLETYVK